MSKRKPRILLFDIETAPNLGWIWGKYEQNVIEYVSEWYTLCFVAKWLGEKKLITHALPDYTARYKKDREDDYAVVKAMWELLDEADVVVAHNGDRFDIRKMNARFAFYKMPPPSPYKTVDTKKVAKRYFMFNSNKLNDLGEHLGLGQKVDTGGFELWKGCMEGKKSAWRLMIKYNKQDVKLLEKVYLHLRQWMTNHPNINLVDEKENACPICGSEKMQKRGFGTTRVCKYQRYQCQDCGGWSRGNPIKTNVSIR
jgi:DNA polymerase elongation subunit (family B)